MSQAKSLVSPVSWPPADSNGYMEFVVPLSVDGVTVEGLSLRGACYESHANESVMLQIEVGKPGIRTRIPLSRVDWRPLNGPHRNPRSGNSEYSGLVIGGSHYHPFDLNWVNANLTMRSGNLPFAIEILPDFQSFAEMVDFVEKRFKINKLGQIEYPRWVERLL